MGRRCASHITEGSVLLLSLNGRAALCLSPGLTPYGSDPRILCVVASGETPERVQACPLGAEQHPYNVKSPSLEFFGWRGPLFSAGSWDVLVRKYPSGGVVVGPGFRPVGNPKHSGRLFDLYLTTEGDVPPGQHALVHVLRDTEYRDKGPKTTRIRKWLEHRLQLWKQLAESGTKNIVKPHPSSDCSVDAEDPFIATIEQDAKSLEDILIRNRFLGVNELVKVVRAAIDLCQTADSKDIRLLTFHPRHILRTNESEPKYLFWVLTPLRRWMLPCLK